jgi:hypothetical protein
MKWISPLERVNAVCRGEGCGQSYRGLRLTAFSCPMKSDYALSLSHQIDVSNEEL